MTISELITHKIIPFELTDTKLTSLFSFFLHSAPTIESRTAMNIPAEKLQNNWQGFLEMSDLKPGIIYAEGYSNLGNSCEKNGLGTTTEITRRKNGFICIRKGKEFDYECVLRHIRNSIAHNNVFYCNAGNRKYVLFEDYNQKQKLTARLLFSQTLLTSLKREITK